MKRKTVFVLMVDTGELVVGVWEDKAAADAEAKRLNDQVAIAAAYRCKSPGCKGRRGVIYQYCYCRCPGRPPLPHGRKTYSDPDLLYVVVKTALVSK
jgi:hypothetical protein